MDFKLETREYYDLRRIQKKTGLPPRQYKKVTVLIMLHQGHKVSVIESALGLDDNTIRRYVKLYKDLDVEDYLKDNYVRYEGCLSSEQEGQLIQRLDEYLYCSAKEVCDYVKKQFEVEYTVSGMTALLHRLGYVYKKSKAVPSKADNDAQLAFLNDKLPDLLSQVRDKQAVIYYADGCHPTHNTKTSRGWIRKGQEFLVDCNSGRKRVNINAAVNALKPEHIVYETCESVNAQSTKRICQALLKKHPGKKIYYVCDNARYNRNKMLQKWAKNQRIQFVFLPSYSPNLNLIERLWRFMKAKFINSYYFEQYSEFYRAIELFLSNTKKYKKELRRLMTLNFKTVNGQSVCAHSLLG